MLAVCEECGNEYEASYSNPLILECESCEGLVKVGEQDYWRDYRRFRFINNDVIVHNQQVFRDAFVNNENYGIIEELLDLPF